MNLPIRLIIYTEDTLLALGAMSVITASTNWNVTVASGGLLSLVRISEEVTPDVILIDLNPEMSLGFIESLRAVAPQARLILWARSFSDEMRYQAREMGVTGLLARTLPKERLVANLIALADGHEVTDIARPAHSTTVSLTSRESQLVTLLVQGLRNKEISTCLGITEGTVRVYLSKLFAKIGARDRFEVAVFGLKNAYCGQSSWDGQNGFITEANEGRARPILKSLVLVEPEGRRSEPRQEAARALGA